MLAEIWLQNKLLYSTEAVGPDEEEGRVRCVIEETKQESKVNREASQDRD